MGIKQKNNSPFTLKGLPRIIRNEKYMGKVISGDKIYYDIIPAIVDENLFRGCNLIMDEHKHKQRVIVEDNSPDFNAPIVSVIINGVPYNKGDAKKQSTAV